MTSIDNVGIVMAIAVLAVFLGVAGTLSAAQDAGPVASTPMVSKTVESKVQVESDSSMAEAKAAAAEAKAAAAEAKVAAMEAEAEAKAAAMEAKAEAKAAAAEAKAAMEAEAAPQTHVVDVPVGTSVPGCEETNSCYSPADITINAGDTVEWDNIDTAAHTVTSGSPSDGPSGVFDSSLLMASAQYAFTFEDAGNYDYFCMVHPWMVGTVSVN